MMTDLKQTAYGDLRSGLRPATREVEQNIELSTKSRFSMVVRAVLGVSFEYYDYVMFATFSPFFAKQFFHADDPIAATLNTLLVFALGFVMRPIGAMLAGHLADKFGRKPIMLVSLAIAAIGSLAIALTPTYQDIGLLAVAVLVTARLFQGLAHGMESISAFTYIAEVADRRHRATQTCAYAIGMNLGVMQATIFGVILTSLLDNDAMQQWGWRIPFVIGAVYGLFILLLRRGIRESAAFTKKEAAGQAKVAYWPTVWKYRKTVVMLLLIWSAVSTTAYTFQVGFSEYAISSLGANPRDAFWAAFIAQLVYMVAVVGWARVSDRRGRKFNYTIGFTGLLVAAFPLQLMLGPSLLQIALPMTIALAMHAAVASTEIAFVNEQIPNHVRPTVMSIPSSFGAVLFGATAPYMKTFATAYASPFLFTGYYCVLCLVALITMRMMPETVGRDLEE
ncbi:hypothetical protein ASC97_32320 [Rhizobium sp. Root1203]|uniref:MFS transporter n=1 Tax=Rhizobium sp. Root1203 TaxID=1736427 RepID=UPI00070C54B9|nr:MFS transporter [Rhizobium sp. Root1203]KQV12120.1 hypothetical protein ASC97_32320 [Rhizobium sp. Root1203]